MFLTVAYPLEHLPDTSQLVVGRGIPCSARENSLRIYAARAKLFSRLVMKIAIATIFQFVLFLIVFGAGSLFPPFHFEHILIATPGSVRIFVADGLLMMFGLYILILIVEAVRKRLRTSAPWSTLAVLLAALLGLMMKFGFLTRSSF